MEADFELHPLGLSSGAKIKVYNYYPDFELHPSLLVNFF